MPPKGKIMPAGIDDDPNVCPFTVPVTIRLPLIVPFPLTVVVLAVRGPLTVAPLLVVSAPPTLKSPRLPSA